jgi:hypothetical protein
MQFPFFAEREAAETVLIAGAGDGFDVFTGLPLYFHLRNESKTVHPVNLSFTELAASPSPEIAPSLYEVAAHPIGPRRQFPERHLAHWFKYPNEEMPIRRFPRSGAKPIAEAYRFRSIAFGSTPSSRLTEGRTASYGGTKTAWGRQRRTWRVWSRSTL